MALENGSRREMGGMKLINSETLMGHITGISDSYYRPTKHNLLKDYFKVAVDLLTILGENDHLEQQIAKLKAQSDQAAEPCTSKGMQSCSCRLKKKTRP